jgi:bleomycin hydrolase
MKRLVLLLLFAPLLICGVSQDEIQYKLKQNGFYQDSIQPAIKKVKVKSPDQKENRYLTMDFGDVRFPVTVSDYSAHWHNPPISQGATGTCWCFAAISLMESEAYRISGKKVKLSEMYMVYWEYVARARYFVQHRGVMYFGQGSESNAVARTMQTYGLVPQGQYPGKKSGQKFHDHNKMAGEIRNFLNYVKTNDFWNEEAVLSTVREILDRYLGVPPTMITVEDKSISPRAYMTDYLQLAPQDYYSFMSTRSMAYNEKGELQEPDNWWHNDDYYNISLEDFSNLLPTALEQGYTVSICGDVSEPGYDRYKEVGIVPTFDIPAEYIDSHAREFRLYNGTTTDDHCIHVVGWQKFNGDLWYLIKDSSSSAFDGPNRGYRFIREDYVKLKIIALFMHKYAARPVLDKIIK